MEALTTTLAHERLGCSTWTSKVPKTLAHLPRNSFMALHGPCSGYFEDPSIPRPVHPSQACSGNPSRVEVPLGRRRLRAWFRDTLRYTLVHARCIAPLSCVSIPFVYWYPFRMRCDSNRVRHEESKVRTCSGLFTRSCSLSSFVFLTAVMVTCVAKVNSDNWASYTFENQSLFAVGQGLTSDISGPPKRYPLSLHGWHDAVRTSEAIQEAASKDPGFSEKLQTGDIWRHCRRFFHIISGSQTRCTCS